MDKVISLFARQSIVNIAYEIANTGKDAVALWFGSEFNFCLLAGYAKDRYYKIEGVNLGDNALASRGENEGVLRVNLVDEWKGFVVSLELDRAATLWRFPIETVSQSESGFEKTYQSSVVFPNWKFALNPGEKWRVKIVLRIEE